MKYIGMLLIIAGIGYGFAYINSPTDNSELEVVAIYTGTNENDDAVIKVPFEIDLDKKPIFTEQMKLDVDWTRGWKLESYNLKTDGEFNKNDLKLDSIQSAELIVDTEEHLDQNGYVEGYLIFTSEDVDALRDMERSSVGFTLRYDSFVKTFQISDSTGWSNERISVLN
ncbi:hypothetical protein ACLIA0_13710 [Bacillaceae bacterium W0354]